MSTTTEQLRHYVRLAEEAAHGPAIDAARRIWPDLRPTGAGLAIDNRPDALEQLTADSATIGGPVMSSPHRGPWGRPAPLPVGEVVVPHFAPLSPAEIAREARNRGYLVTGNRIWPKVTADPWGDAR